MAFTLLSTTGQTLVRGVFVGVIAVVLYRAYVLHMARRRFKFENGCLPIKNQIKAYIPWIGVKTMLMQMKAAKEGRLLETAVERNRDYGPTFYARILFTDFIMTSDPQNIKAVLATRFKDFGLGNLRSNAVGPLLGHGIFASDGERWQKSRSLIRPNFMREQIADLNAFERHFQTMLTLIPRDGSTVDLQALFFAFTIDSATEFLFGHSVESLQGWKDGNTGTESAFANAFNYAQSDAMARFRLRQFVHFHKDPKADRAIAFCHSYVQKFVDNALRARQAGDKAKETEEGRTGGKYVFLEELARNTSDPIVLRDELLNVLLAGRDTTASLLGNLFFVLAKRPDIWSKLRDEIAELEGVPPTYETLRNLKYLKYCLNESLRTHPVVPANARKANVDTVLPRGGGPDGQSPIFVKKDTVIGYSVYAMHRRKDLYGEDAMEFKPERWQTLRPDWSYLPFNAGPRICVGQQYALTEAAYVTTRLLQSFERMESRDPEEWKELMTLTVCSKNGTKVALFP